MTPRARSGAPRPAGHPTLTRRTVVGSALAAGSAFGLASLAGCSGPANAADRTRIQLWHLFTGGDGGVFQEMLQRVGAANPDLDIAPVVLTWGAPYYTKLAMASIGGRSPDLAVMHLTRISGYAPGGLLEPWDPTKLAEHGITADRFPQLLWERSHVDGQLFAIPLDFHAFVLFFNKAICGQAGVLGPDGMPAGLDSTAGFLDVAHRLADVTGDSGVSYGYTGDGAQMSRLFWGLYAQTGGVCELVPGQEAVFEPDKAVEVVTFVKDMLDGRAAKANLDYGAAVASFSTGRTGFTFMGNWELQSYLSAGIDVDAMPMPPVFGIPGTFGDSHVFVLPRQANVDPERRDAAYRVLAGMLENSLAWADGGHIPADNGVRDSAAYRALVPQSHYAAAIEQAVFEPEAWFTGSGSDFQARLGEVLQGCWLGGTSPEQAVDGLVSRLNAALATQPPA